jgi:CO/xanthine dehydrogenase Mo-binding subunit
VQLRRAAATAHQALLAQAAQRLGRSVGDLEIADGVVRAKDRPRHAVGDLARSGR